MGRRKGLNCTDVWESSSDDGYWIFKECCMGWVLNHMWMDGWMDDGNGDARVWRILSGVRGNKVNEVEMPSNDGFVHVYMFQQTSTVRLSATPYTCPELYTFKILPESRATRVPLRPWCCSSEGSLDLANRFLNG